MDKAVFDNINFFGVLECQRDLRYLTYWPSNILLIALFSYLLYVCLEKQ